LRLPLPESWKKRLRATDQWLAIGLVAPQQVVDASLITAGGIFDVTGNSAVAALRPLTILVGMEAQLHDALRREPMARLQFLDRLSKQIIGVLHLRYLREWSTSGTRIGLFEVVSGRHYCAHWPRRQWDSWMYQRASRNTPTEKRLMAPAATEQVMVFFLCPRPVYFVSVDDGHNSNIFPMDLVGPLVPGRFTLALRNTSPSVETIGNSRKLALADIPYKACLIAYGLGKHHQQQRTDWETLPFKVRRAREFQLPFPEIALRVREIEILDQQAIGSHMLFVGHIVSDERLAEGAQLFHTTGIYQKMRARNRQPFEEALPGAARSP
jgi:flavin reductase (DIM6/NTAB) family NADH-FMN oxidoreductase RutF